MPPRVSILIPCYKGERYLAAAIESCLAQTLRDFEVIAIDDASPDGCARIVEEFAARDSRVTLIRREKNGGISRALNDGMARGHGRFITRVAQDDLFAPEFLERMTAALEASPDAGLAYCDEWRIDEKGAVIERALRPEPDRALAGGNKIGLGVMWRREVFERIGGFDPEFDTAEDYDYWLRLAKEFPLVHVGGEPLFSVRIHGEMGSQVHSARQELLSARLRARELAGTLARRRELARGYFLAGYNLREQNRALESAAHLLRAWCWWPLDLRPLKCAAGLLFRRGQ